MSVAMGNGSSSVKEVAKHITASNQQDGIHKALGALWCFGFRKSVCQSETTTLIRSKPSTT